MNGLLVFFALGLAKKTKQPTAIVVTSGTAVAELYPALIEAYYSGVSLVLVSADRPRRFRKTGAPQCIEQVDIFHHYVEECIDLEWEESFSSHSWLRNRCYHINVCFEEPLTDINVRDKDWMAEHLRVVFKKKQSLDQSQYLLARNALSDFFSKSKKPLVIVGSLLEYEIVSVENFLSQMKVPIYAEGTSGIRESKILDPYLIKSGEKLLNYEDFDGVLKIGGVPTLKMWRNLSGVLKHIPVVSISSSVFKGMPHAQHIQVDLEILLDGSDYKSNHDQDWCFKLLQKDQLYYQKLIELLKLEPLSQAAVYHQLSCLIPESSRVYVGNSLPIRKWDFVASREKAFHVMASRGANGIDGQISTFLGLVDGVSWGIFGDLTTLYDLNALYLLKDIPEKRIAIVVINNGGGKIFSSMFKNPKFQNRHHLEFSHWAQSWGLSYLKYTKLPEKINLSETTVIEIHPNEKATQRFHKSYEKLFFKI